MSSLVGAEVGKTFETYFMDQVLSFLQALYHDMGKWSEERYRLTRFVKPFANNEVLTT